MNPTLEFDMRDFDKAIKNITFSQDGYLEIEQKGATVLVDGMKQRAAKDTHDMENSVKPHVIENKDLIVDEVGPEVSYAVYQEYGTGIYAESGKGRQTPWVYRRKDGTFVTTQGNRPHPFVRPTAVQDKNEVIGAMEKEFKRKVVTSWSK